MKNHVLELKKAVFEKQKGYARERAIEKSWIIYFCCLCSRICIHKSTLMSRFKAKQADIKSREHFLDAFETLQVKSARSETASGTHKTETFPIPRVLMVRMSRKEAIFDVLYTKEDIVYAFPVDDEDNLERGGLKRLWWR